MSDWAPAPEGFGDAAWDRAVASLPDGNVFQTSVWAAHKRAFGWSALRLARGGVETPQALAQFLVKRLAGGARLLWARGGAIGAPELWDGALRAAAVRAAGGLLIYGRLCSYRESSAAGCAALEANGWRRPHRPLDGGATFLLDLSPEPAALESALSKNWGHNLRRGRKRSAVRPWVNPDPGELIAVYRTMEAYKGLKTQYSEAQLSSLLACLGERVVLWRADGQDGKPIALRACAVDGAKAWDLLAASTEEGRKNYASYALLWSLLEQCRCRGAKRYDLGGADAETARGVFDFKKGTGARHAVYLGEWDWASPSWARRPAGYAASAKAA